MKNNHRNKSTQNLMSIPIPQSNKNTDKIPYSLMAELYRSWEEYQIPAVYYHYLLTTLPKINHKQQVLIMSKQIKALKSGHHYYHRIVNAIQARERSLSAIFNSMHIFFNYESTTEMKWPEYQNKEDIEIGGNYGYKVIHEDQKAGILSPRKRQSAQKDSIVELVNHIRMYQRVTIQIILLVNQWQEELIQIGYSQSVIQFHYRKQDYLLVIPRDVERILDQYSQLFENNPFFIMKKAHEKTQFALIYEQLKTGQEIGAKIYECLNILANHEANILRQRMLAKNSQNANKYRKISKANTDIHRIYANYNNGRDYIMIKDHQAKIKFKNTYNPPPISQGTLKKIREDQKNPVRMQKQSHKNNDIIINPQFKYPSVNDKTVRKHPVLLNSEFMNIANQANEDVQKYLLNPLIPHAKKKQPDSAYIINNSNKTKSDRFVNNNRDALKRSQTQDNILKKSNSTILAHNLYKKHSDNSEMLDSISIQNVHGQNMINVGPPKLNKLGEKNKRDNYNDPARNKGLIRQRKLQALEELNSAKKYVENNLPQLRKDQNLHKLKAFPQNDLNTFQTPQGQQQIHQSQKITQLSQNSQLTLIFQQKIKPTQIVKHLRNKVFNNIIGGQEANFEEIQELAKKILLDQDFITFIRVQSKGLRIAWLAVKFLTRDHLTMKRAVMIVYIRKFLKLTNFERKLLDTFVSHGYGVIRNEQKILYQIDILDVVTRPLVKIKYKVSVVCEKQTIKQTIKSNKSLKYSRLLKYYSYSKNSKYHKFCDHFSPNVCSFSINFSHVYKATFDRLQYFVAKADNIVKLSNDDQIYKISSIAMNGTQCIIARTLSDIIALEKQDDIERDSSFDSKLETEYSYIAIRQSKIMRKYVQNVSGTSAARKKYEYQETVVSQFITVGGKIPEVRSIMKTKEQAQKKSILIMEAPFYMAAVTNEEGQTKILAILEFQ